MFEKLSSSLLLTSAVVLLSALPVGAESSVSAQSPVPAMHPDLDVERAVVEYRSDLDLLVFEIQVAGQAGGTGVEARGAMDGAPVLGYVFPTTLKPRDVGFETEGGVVALAVTTHPDFDDTPLWDENRNRDYADDGAVFHTHWVVLVPDERVPGGLAVAETGTLEIAEVLPPTHPGMPMFMDSPGYSVLLQGKSLKVLVPASRIYGEADFRYDAVTAYMEVGPQDDRPMLGVYKVYDVLSGDLSLPFEIRK